MAEEAPFVDAIVWTASYQRNVVGSLLFFVVAHYAAYFLLRNLPAEYVEFNEKAKKHNQDRQKFLRESASAVVAFLYHSLAAPYACYLLYRLVMVTAPSLTHASLVTRDPTLGMDHPMWLLQDDLMMLSEVFIGYMLCLIYFFALGWEQGWVPLVHHVTFLGMSVISANFNFLVGAASLTMEMSSPALNLHLIYRNLAGEWAQQITTHTVTVFALQFFIFRIIVFGTSVILGSYIIFAEEMPVPMNWYKTGAIESLFFVGMGLQVYWLRELYVKAQRQKKRTAKKGD